MRVAIFDSGVGGLTVLEDAIRRVPSADFLYFADTDNVPYGTKSKEEVRRLTVEAAKFIADLGTDVLVIACNTATSAAASELRHRFSFPVVAMEPAVKPAVTRRISAEGRLSLNADKRVLVAATPLTLREEKFQRLVASLDTEGIVDPLPLPELVDFAERLEFSDSPVLSYLRKATIGQDLGLYSTVVLGCTHFLFFRPQFRSLFPPDTEIIDGNEGTVSQLIRTMEGLKGINRERSVSPFPGRVLYFESMRPVTDPPALERFRRLRERYALVREGSSLS